MKWRRKQREEKKEGKKRKEEEVKKQTSYWSNSSSSSSSSSSSFSLSSVLPFSWLAKLTASKPPHKPKRSGVAGGGSGRRVAEVLTPPPSPSRHPRCASAHLPFSSAVLDRFPPPAHDVAAPGRLSLGDDEGAGLRQRVASASARQHRSARHHSAGDLEVTLGHIIPFSRRAGAARWAESDSGTDASGCDLGIGRRPPRRRRRQRRSGRASAVLSPEQRAGSEGKEGLPRRSISGKIRQRAKVKVRSPRPMVAELERLRAAARRGRGEAEEGGGGGRRKKGLERFAVVKCSCDPQRDFRESMVEMIWQKGIGRPEELESLLACYLSLNADEHHDVIVKVFRQVWFELNPERLASECNLQR